MKTNFINSVLSKIRGAFKRPAQQVATLPGSARSTVPGGLRAQAQTVFGALEQPAPRNKGARQPRRRRAGAVKCRCASVSWEHHVPGACQLAFCKKCRLYFCLLCGRRDRWTGRYV